MLHSLHEVIARRGIPGLDEATEEMPHARRNLLVGLWAGQHVSSSGSAFALFEVTVMTADHEEVGDSDVLGALDNRFTRAGIAVPEEEIRVVQVQCRAYADILCDHLWSGVE
jgi:hypothetical protein